MPDTAMDARLSEEGVVRMTPHIGATIRDITLSPDMSDETVSRFEAAMANYQLVRLPEHDLDAAALRDVVARFGPIFLHHSDEGVLYADGLPEVLEMRKEPDGARLFGGSDWHADVTFRNPAGQYSFLHAKILPPLGGDTGFASTIAAFSALSDGMKDFLRGLEAVHSYDGPGRPDHATESATHPVVRRHPDTGAEGLYINRMFATRFTNMTEAESKPIIDFLDRHMSRPEFSCRLHWSEGDLVVWDNRFTLHYPINDFTGHRRLLIRCTTLEKESASV